MEAILEKFDKLKKKKKKKKIFASSPFTLPLPYTSSKRLGSTLNTIIRRGFSRENRGYV